MVCVFWLVGWFTFGDFALMIWFVFVNFAFSIWFNDVDCVFWWLLLLVLINWFWFVLDYLLSYCCLVVLFCVWCCLLFWECWLIDINLVLFYIVCSFVWVWFDDLFDLIGWFALWLYGCGWVCIA